MKLFFTVSILLSLCTSCMWRKVQVTVVNRDTEALHDVVVHVTGNSYALGTVEPGQKAEIGVRSTGESHIEISFVDAGGNEIRFKVGCYFEAGYGGSIRVELGSEKILHVDDEIRI